jgi:signal peptidase I
MTLALAVGSEIPGDPVDGRPVSQLRLTKPRSRWSAQASFPNTRPGEAPCAGSAGPPPEWCARLADWDCLACRSLGSAQVSRTAGTLSCVRILDRSRSRLPKPLRTLTDWALTIMLAAVAVLVFQAEVAKPYRIPSPSMEPTLHCAKPASGCLARVSDRVIANRLVYRFHEPRRGDIIVFEASPRVEAACTAGGIFIKRIVGLPGEKLSMRKGLVFVNGIPLAEPYLRLDYRGSETADWARVAKDSYFVLGDNRAMSCDSRRWGVVPRDSIIGRAEVIYWPPTRLGEP